MPPAKPHPGTILQGTLPCPAHAPRFGSSQGTHSPVKHRKAVNMEAGMFLKYLSTSKASLDATRERKSVFFRLVFHKLTEALSSPLVQVQAVPVGNGQVRSKEGQIILL